MCMNCTNFRLQTTCNSINQHYLTTRINQLTWKLCEHDNIYSLLQWTTVTIELYQSSIPCLTLLAMQRFRMVYLEISRKSVVFSRYTHKITHKNTAIITMNATNALRMTGKIGHHIIIAMLFLLSLFVKVWCTCYTKVISERQIVNTCLYSHLFLPENEFILLREVRLWSLLLFNCSEGLHSVFLLRNSSNSAVENDPPTSAWS